MKKLILLMGMLGMMVLGCGHVGGVKESSWRVTHIADSTVALMITIDGEAHVYCTGVWVSEDEILTANHCVEAAGQIEAAQRGEDPDILDLMGYEGTVIHYTMSGEQGEVGQAPSAIHSGRAIKLSKEKDLALVRIDPSKVKRAHQVAKVANMSPAVGERVYIMGHVVGLYWTYIEGVISAYRETLPLGEDTPFTGPYVQISCAAYKGNSGGGAFNSDGELVGIASFLLRSPNTVIFVHLDNIQAFLKK